MSCSHNIHAFYYRAIETSIEKIFFEIPVYRIAEADYKKQMEAHIRKHIPTYRGLEDLLRYRLDNPGKSHPDEPLVGVYSKEYGGPWRYNEIIGHLRLYLYGHQIRVEYWQTQAKRIVKSRKKLFGSVSTKIVDEVTVKDLDSNKEIKGAIEAAIKLCENKFKNRYFDMHYFNAIKDHVSWVNVLLIEFNQI